MSGRNWGGNSRRARDIEGDLRGEGGSWMASVGCFFDLRPMTDEKEGKVLPDEFLDTGEDGLSLAYCLLRSCFEDLEARGHQVRGCSARRADDMKKERRGGEKEGTKQGRTQNRCMRENETIRQKEGPRWSLTALHTKATRFATSKHIINLDLDFALSLCCLLSD